MLEHCVVVVLIQGLDNPALRMLNDMEASNASVSRLV